MQEYAESGLAVSCVTVGYLGLKSRLSLASLLSFLSFYFSLSLLQILLMHRSDALHRVMGELRPERVCGIESADRENGVCWTLNWAALSNR